MKNSLPTSQITIWRHLALSALMAGYGAGLQAQTAPADAGRILRDEQARNRITAPPARADIPFNIDKPSIDKVPSGGPKMRVRSFRFVGNVAIDSDLLLAALIDAKDTELDLAGLRQLADRVSSIYRLEGYPFSQAFLPKQEVKDGVVVIEVVEGRYGKVDVTDKSGDQASLRPYLGELRSGDLIEERKLEQAILLMAEIPGVVVSPVFSPGTIPGTSDLSVGISRDESWRGSVRLDNHGLRYSGAHRLQAEASRPGLFRLGDKTSFNVMVTDENLLLGGVRYDYPLGSSGLRLNAGYARTDYQLGAGFEGFTGIADTWSAGLSYPVRRSQRTNLTLSLGADFRLLTDANMGVAYENRDVALLSAGLQFDHRDLFLGGGVSYGEIKITAGNVSSDVVSSVQGSFGKVNAQVARLQNAGKGFVVYGSVVAQASDRLLNSSESFSLGGVTGVRSYPNGEAQGSNGALAQLELRYEAGALTPYLFYDQGEIFSQNAVPSRSLGGIGPGVRYRAGNLMAEAACAWRTNGGESTSDSKQQDPRFWVSMGYRY
jgi:hemolysin activation/secretion protein